MDLVLKNLKLIDSAIKSVGFVDSDDYFQDGALALINCAKNFNPHLGFKFSSYAWNSIRRKIIRGTYNKLRLIKIPYGSYGRYVGLNPDRPNKKATGREKRLFNIICSVNRAINIDQLSDYVDYREPTINKLELMDALRILDKRELYIVKKRFYRKLTYRKIADQLCMSHENVRLIEKRALKKLRKHFN